MKRNKKQRKVLTYLLVVLGITVGYALLSTTLKINGTAGIKSNTWDIHWENVVPNTAENTVTAEKPQITQNATKVTYEVDLELPGDFYEFTVDAKNDGSINGKITKVDHKVYLSTDLEHPLSTANIPSYMISTIYYDGTTTAPAEGDILDAGQKQTYRIRIEYDREATTLPSTDTSYVIVDEITYTQTKESTYVPTGADYIIDQGTITPNGKAPVTVGHHQTDKTPATDVTRYMGADPDNYILFNCDNESDQSTSTCEMWRIIGVSYDGYIKIIKNDALPTKKVWSTQTTNDWSTADLKTYLNGDYYNGLKYSAKKAIAEKTWFTNGWSASDYGDGWGALPEYAYIKERSSVNNGGATPIANSVTAKVGLMYASDYAFASSGCYSLCPATASSEDSCSSTKYNIADGWGDNPDYHNQTCTSSNWLYKGTDEWTITPNYLVNRTYYAMSIVTYNSNAGTAMWDGIDASHYIRPVVYLKKEVLLNGSGTQADPYKIRMTGWNFVNPGSTGDSQLWEYWTSKTEKLTSTAKELKDFSNNDRLYHFDSNGYVIYGWHKIDDKVYYSSFADADGNGYTDGGVFRGGAIEVTDGGLVAGGTGTFTFDNDGACISANCPTLN